MEKSEIGHLVYNIQPENSQFYRDLLSFLGFTVIHEDPEMLGLLDGNRTSIWFGKPILAARNDYDGLGLNHIGIHTKTIADVDEVVAYLAGRGIPALFDTPCHRPEMAGPTTTYYQVMFESPDRILFEVVYYGPLTN